MRVQKLIETAQLPARGTAAAAGYDLVAAERTVIPPSVVRGLVVDIGRAVVRTGLAIELPPNTVGRIGSRSGLSVKRNIEAGAGWIDPDYRGEVLVELKNLSGAEVVFEVGDRIAQLFIMPVRHPKVAWAKSLSKTKRGDGGFGSTGVEAKTNRKVVRKR
jgi:dUTP pyrophosphatase